MGREEQKKKKKDKSGRNHGGSPGELAGDNEKEGGG